MTEDPFNVTVRPVGALPSTPWPVLVPLMRLSPLSRKTARFATPTPIPALPEEALAEYIKGLWTAFLDFHIEVLNAGEIEPGLVAHLKAARTLQS